MIRALALLLPLGACAVAQQTADIVAREEARRVVNARIDAIAPGTNATLVTDCIINGASAQELLVIASASPAATQTITAILQRPAVTNCAANAALAVLL